MTNLRKYGKAPFCIALIHGGPGAAGEMAPVARELSAEYGILEPLQTKSSIGGQIQELKDVLEDCSELPVTLIGHSWGAMLGFMFTARNQSMVKKLILLSAAAFEDGHTADIMKARYGRMTKDEKARADFLSERLNDPIEKNKNLLFAELGKIMLKADSYDPFPVDEHNMECRYDIFLKVWKEAKELRHSGKLLECANQIHCPVVAIHGDDDPHPFRGVQGPLSRALKNFKLIRLDRCGHSPWNERDAKRKFYKILREELSSSGLS